MTAFNYTQKFTGDSSVLDAIYFDGDSQEVAFVFHGGTVAFRHYAGTEGNFQSLLNAANGSMGRVWNSVFRDRAASNPTEYEDNITFTSRVSEEQADPKHLYGVVISVYDVTWDGIQEIIALLSDHGYTGILEAAVRSE